MRSTSQAGLIDDVTTTFKVGAVQLTIKAELMVPHDSIGAFAHSIYEDRRLLERAFGTKLFNEPSWDILLYLFAAEVEGKPVSITSAAHAASAPFTTAQRRVGTLEAQGLVIRSSASDRRTVNLRLTDFARDKMTLVLLNMLANHIKIATVAAD